MSFVYSLSSLKSDQRRFIKKECIVKPNVTQYNKNPDPLYLFKVVRNQNQIFLPLRLFSRFYDKFPDSEWESTVIEFVGELWENEKRDQQTIASEMLVLLGKYHSCLLAGFTGLGKTQIATYLSTRLGYKVLVLCHFSSLHTQWKETFEKATSAKVQIVKGKKLNDDADVYVMGLIKCGNVDSISLKKIGVVIIDEAHTCPAPVLSKCLLNIFPKYLIGLSATPDREDGLHKTLYRYFGPKKQFIVRTETKPLNIIKLISPFVPDFEYNYRGELDWTSLQNSLAYNEDRHRMIVEIIQSYPNDKVMVLTKRQQEGYALVELLKEAKEDVDYLIGSKKKWREECRILIGGIKKIGVGFNDPTRSVLILASDVKDIRQNEGRLRAYGGIIIDIVDRFNTLEKHWKQRREWYLERGGSITVEKRWCENFVVEENKNEPTSFLV